jgi:hypothetical protein
MGRRNGVGFLTRVALIELASVDVIEIDKPRAGRERIHPVTIIVALVIVVFWMIQAD